MADDATTNDGTPEELTVPSDLQQVGIDELEQLRDSVAAARRELRERAQADPASITDEDAERATALRQAAEAIAADLQRRADEADARLAAVMESTADPDDETGDDPADPDGGEGDPVEGDPVDGEPTPVAAGEPVAAASRTPVTVPAVAKRPTLNPSLSLAAIAQEQRPATERVLAQVDAAAGRMAEAPALQMELAGDIPGVEHGQPVTLASLADAFVRRAETMAITSGRGVPMPVAAVRRTFPHTLSTETSGEDAGRALEDIISGNTSFQGMANLVASGGWCAPSEIDYGFFSVEDAPAGRFDAPTVGISRGGLRWPVTLDLADFFVTSGAPASGIPTNATMPWEWTETDDILAATGTTPRKACLTAPCPTFVEERLRLWGICVKAGNLADAAYPEAIRRFIALTVIAHARVMNRRMIAMAVAGNSTQLPAPTAVTPGRNGASSEFVHALGAAELEATHLRAKYGASRDAVVEYALPYWVRGVYRSDMAKRNGWSDLAMTDAFIAQQFDARNIRVQWLEDWQHNTGWDGGSTIGAATAPTVWPTSYQGLMFFPGHYFMGRGMSLNLGVVRDSVLNATNDHTAAWSEEAHFIGARGPESLLLTHSNVLPSGITGLQVAASAGV